MRVLEGRDAREATGLLEPAPFQRVGDRFGRRGIAHLRACCPGNRCRAMPISLV